MCEINYISFIGSGNVATNLALDFLEKGIEINQVYSRSLENAKVLSGETNSKAINNISELDLSVDAIIISTADDAIQNLSNQIKAYNGIVMHTSGSISIDVLSHHKNYGVLYPLQTLSKNVKENITNVPILIEANSANNLETIEKLSRTISDKVSKIESEERKAIHLAAVISNNFTNHIFTLLNEYCLKSNVDFDLLKPLIEKTILKVNPQTGPAKRGDLTIINDHIEMLSNYPDLMDLYKNISSNISHYYGHKTEL